MTQIHSSYLTSPAKTKTFFPEVKNKWRKKSKKKKGGAGRALLEGNTGSWHPKRQRAMLWHRGSGHGGTGRILIYKIDVLANF